MTRKRQALLIRFTLFFFSIFFSGCLMNNQISALVKKGKPLNINVTNIQVINNKIIVTGSNLDKVATLNINEGPSTIHFFIESQSTGSLVASALSNVVFTSGKLFDLIFSSADAAATFTITFSVADNSITASMLTSMGASKGQVMKYNGTNWVPGPLTNAQIYLGTWDASTNTPDLSTPSTDPGDYYIVSNAGSFNSVNYSAGDWIISDGYNWQRVANSTVAVSSFNGRRGIVNLRPSDYVSLKDSVTHKVTGSSLNDIADIDLTTILPLNGDVLTFNGVKWVAATPSSSGGAVSSVNGNTGAVTLTTTNISEGTNLYHTDARVLNTSLTAVTLTNVLVAIGDSVQAALGKLQAQISSSNTNISSKADTTNLSQTITAATVTGLTAPVAGADAANKTYVDNAISGISSSNISGSGTANYLTKFSASTTLANSLIYDNGTVVGIGLLPDSYNTSIPFRTSGMQLGNSRTAFNEGHSITHAPNVDGTSYTTATAHAFTVVGGYGYVNRNESWLGGGFSEPAAQIIRFYTATNFNATTGSERMLIDNNGKVGIGTSSPGQLLSVAGTIESTSGGFKFPDGTTQTTAAGGSSLWTVSGNDVYHSPGKVGIGATPTYDFDITSSNTPVMRIKGMGANYVNAGIVLENGTSDGQGEGIYYLDTLATKREWFWGKPYGMDAMLLTASALNISGHDQSIASTFGGGTTILSALGNGNVGIGTNSPSYKFQVGAAGDGSEARANAWNVLSDERLKRDFAIIPDALEKILSLHGYYYSWNRGTDQSKKMGLKAQEVKKVFPEVVSKGADGFLSVSYNHLVAAVIESLKEFFSKWNNDSKDLHFKIQELEKENRSLKRYLCQKDKSAEFCR